MSSYDAPSKEVMAFLKMASRMDYEVDLVTEFGVQLRRKKTYSNGYFLSGLVTAIIGIGFLILLIGWFEYWTLRDEVVFFSWVDLEPENVRRAADFLVQQK